jgi:mannose-6-phosphate isomerase-like protein (cupin superfamily)
MKEIWITKSTIIEKPWGTEQIWQTGGWRQISSKILYLKEGYRTSLKYNNIKNEVLFILSGRLLLTYSNERFRQNKEFKSCYLTAGETINIQSECPYRLKAIEDTVVVEVGDRPSTQDSIVRFHDDYGRHPKTGDELINDMAQQAIYESGHLGIKQND